MQVAAICKSSFYVQNVALIFYLMKYRNVPIARGLDNCISLIYVFQKN